MPTRERLVELDLAELEELTGITYKTLRKRLEGVAPIREDGRAKYYSPPEALGAIYQTAGPGKLEAERARLAAAQADAQEMKNAELRGEMIPAADNEESLITLASAFQRRALALPTRCAPLVAVESDVSACEAILRERVKDFLTDLSNAAIEAQTPQPPPDDGAEPAGGARRGATAARSDRKRVGRRRARTKR